MPVKQIETAIAVGVLCYLAHDNWALLGNWFSRWIRIVLISLRLAWQQIENRKVNYAAAAKTVEVATVNTHRADAATYSSSFAAHDPDLSVSTGVYVTQIVGEIHLPSGPVLPFEPGELEAWLAAVFKTSRIPGPQTDLVTPRD